MKIAILLVIATVITTPITNLKQAYEDENRLAERLSASERAYELVKDVPDKKPETKAKSDLKRSNVPNPTISEPVRTCREAIARTWPVALRDGAYTVLENENRQEDPSAVSGVNSDGSRDYGCFQVNSYWHASFFASKTWSNPLDNAQYAYSIYEERKALDGIGWTAWYAVEGILW